MKKLLFFIHLLFSLGVNAQESKHSEAAFSLKYLFSFPRDYSDRVEIIPQYGYRFNRILYAGIGSGIAINTGGKNIFIPVFGKLNADLMSSKARPFVSFRGGYEFHVNLNRDYSKDFPDIYKSGVFIEPVVGIKISMISVGIGYYLKIKGVCTVTTSNSVWSMNHIDKTKNYQALSLHLTYMF